MKPFSIIAGLILMGSALGAAQQFNPRPVLSGGELWAQARSGDDRGNRGRGRGKRVERGEEPSDRSAPPQENRSRRDSRSPRFRPEMPSSQGDARKRNWDRSPHPVQPGERHVGSWLRQYGHLPADEQQRALDRDSEFQRLPQDAQSRLRERLRKFNDLPAERRDRVVERMDAFQHLSREQRERLSANYNRMRELPEDRGREVRRAVREMREMNAEERYRILDSERFRRQFNGSEQGIIRGLLESLPHEGHDPGKQD